MRRSIRREEGRATFRVLGRTRVTSLPPILPAPSTIVSPDGHSQTYTDRYTVTRPSWGTVTS